MTEETKSPRESVAKAIAWPLVAVVVLVLFRGPIAELVPGVRKVSVGSLSIETDSKLGVRATPAILQALEGLTESSIFTLISRNLPVTCFSPPVDAEFTRTQHKQLVEKRLLEEIPAPNLVRECRGISNPTIGYRLTSLGEQTRSFQLATLAEFAKPAEGKAKPE